MFKPTSGDVFIENGMNERRVALILSFCFQKNYKQTALSIVSFSIVGHSGGGLHTENEQEKS